MQSYNEKSQDFIRLWNRYDDLGTGFKAELRRVAAPDDLIEIPAFYRLTRGYGSHKNIRRLVYCLPHLKHRDGGDSLGKALAEAGVREKRLFMVIRSQEPNDLIQLRRLLQQVNPIVDFSQTAWLLLRWDKPEQKQKLLENFFLHQKESH
ncbi:MULTISPECIES: type I-E CRISPR-associated protein Cse2/CasB [unclassified Endozoicomonas]|uniref:type I-E CRISPR-associated protein Cse2/CasB n=1 Tax=Endozoicomonas TaxID=305899 RepID=UPI003BB652DC